MKIGVVTVLYNSSVVLPDFIHSLGGQKLKDFHVWAVDNASTDDSIAQCRLHSTLITVIANQRNEGVAAGNNTGIRAALEAGCETVLLLNNDVVFGPDLLQQLYDGLLAHHCQITTPIMYYFDRPTTIWAAGGKFQPLLGYHCRHLEEGTVDIGQFTQPTTIEHAPTCCVLYRRSVFDAVGFMDERYFVYHDDTDFMLRCLRAGQRLVLLPYAHLLHKVSSLTGGAESEFSVRMGTRNRAYMMTKFMGRLVASPYMLGMLAAYRFQLARGRYTSEQFRTKKKALRQGFLMAANWLPLRKPPARS